MKNFNLIFSTLFSLIIVSYSSPLKAQTFTETNNVLYSIYSKFSSSKNISYDLTITNTENNKVVSSHKATVYENWASDEHLALYKFSNNQLLLSYNNNLGIQRFWLGSINNLPEIKALNLDSKLLGSAISYSSLEINPYWLNIAVSAKDEQGFLVITMYNKNKYSNFSKIEYYINRDNVPVRVLYYNNISDFPAIEILVTNYQKINNTYILDKVEYKDNVNKKYTTIEKTNFNFKPSVPAGFNEAIKLISSNFNKYYDIYTSSVRQSTQVDFNDNKTNEPSYKVLNNNNNDNSANNLLSNSLGNSNNTTSEANPAAIPQQVTPPKSTVTADNNQLINKLQYNPNSANSKIADNDQLLNALSNLNNNDTNTVKPKANVRKKSTVKKPTNKNKQVKKAKPINKPIAPKKNNPKSNDTHVVNVPNIKVNKPAIDHKNNLLAPKSSLNANKPVSNPVVPSVTKNNLPTQSTNSSDSLATKTSPNADITSNSSQNNNEKNIVNKPSQSTDSNLNKQSSNLNSEQLSSPNNVAIPNNTSVSPSEEQKNNKQNQVPPVNSNVDQPEPSAPSITNNVPKPEQAKPADQQEPSATQKPKAEVTPDSKADNLDNLF